MVQALQQRLFEQTLRLSLLLRASRCDRYGTRQRRRCRTTSEAWTGSSLRWLCASWLLRRLPADSRVIPPRWRCLPPTGGAVRDPRFRRPACPPPPRPGVTSSWNITHHRFFHFSLCLVHGDDVWYILLERYLSCPTCLSLCLVHGDDV